MKGFLATMLSVIAVGVLLIAYGLLAPRASAGMSVVYDPQTGVYQLVRPAFVGERFMVPESGAYGGSGVMTPYATPIAYTQGAYPAAPADRTFVSQPAPRAVRTSSAAPQRTVTRVVERPAGRDWKKTALVIGGSTATGAGVGAIFGGKKGALIGAAIGGGASTIYEARKR
jgi:hypothetical protein